MSEQRAQWGSRMGFVLAAAGSAVGLGNIWKFPYITGENGGGLFVLIYLGCILLVGLPIMMAEIMIGRAAQKQPIAAFEELQGGRSGWSAVGWLGVVAGFVILSYYVVVAGWAMDYTLKSMSDFGGKVSESAQLEAMVYRAKASKKDMKEAVVAERVKHATRTDISRIKAKAPQRAWKTYEKLYLKALKEAGGSDGKRDLLLEDASIRAAVDTVTPLLQEIEVVKQKAGATAKADLEKLSDADLRTEAQTVERRRLLYEKFDTAFGALATDGWTSTFWAALFMLLTILIVATGVARGIERACMVLMPTLMGLMAFMVLYGAFQPGFSQALAFVFEPDPSRLRPSGVLEALGHAFFTLSLGMGAMVTYGSYQANKRRLIGTSVTIAGLDTLVALMACLMIFPITFSYGQAPTGGPGLVFKSMPLAFAEIGGGGMLLSTAFFGLLFFAALTSAISLLEVVASYLIDKKGWARPKAAWAVGGAILLFALPSAFGSDADFKLGSWSATYGQSFFDVMDYLATNWMLPLGGLFIAIYAGWIMPKRLRDAELADASAGAQALWLWSVRIIAPALVILVLLQKVGILDVDALLH